MEQIKAADYPEWLQGFRVGVQGGLPELDARAAWREGYQVGLARWREGERAAGQVRAAVRAPLRLVPRW